MMRRTQIFLTDAQSDLLDRLARESRRTRSELIREAIQLCYAGSVDSEVVLTTLRETAGAWKGGGDDAGGGAEYVERLRGGRLASLHGTKP